MKYWSLTAVLLAFWLGRETGADDNDDKDAPKEDIFGVFHCRELVCDKLRIKKSKLGEEAQLTKHGLLVVGRTGASVVAGGEVILWGGKHKISGDLLARNEDQDGATTLCMITLSAKNIVASLLAMCSSGASVGFDAQESGAHMAVNSKNRSGISLSAGGSETALKLSDSKHRRAVLGSHSTKNAKTGEWTSTPCSTLTLIGEKGDVLEQLPK